MIGDLYHLLPEEISDETAFHLVNFLMDLALALESHYLAQVIRYTNDSRPSDLP
jgi:hypothetical protein